MQLIGLGWVRVRWRRRAATLVAALCSATLLGCEIPEAPEWTVGALVPFNSDPLSAADLLPAQVTDTTVGGAPAFSVEDQGSSARYTLGQMCPACASLNGLSAPVPTFDYTDSVDVALPSEVVSVELVSAVLTLRVTNENMNFDPLRPDPDPNTAGYVAIVARDLATGSTLDSVLISGATETLPAGSSIEIPIQLSNVTLTDGVRAIAHVYSPEDGQTVTIDTALAARVDTEVSELVATAVTAVVDAKSLDESVQIDFDRDLREEIAGRTEGGSIELELTHDFDFGGNLDISLAGAPGDLFSGTPGLEVQLLSFDFSYAPDGRVAQRTLSPAEIELLADFPEVWLGYRATAMGLSTDALGRPTTRFAAGNSVQTRIEVSARVKVGG